MSLLIGADPELFFRKGSELLSAHTLLPGSKQYPYVVPFGAVQVDGTAGEFNIDPADSEDTFVLHITEVMRTLESMLDPGITLDICPVREYSEEYMAKLPGYVKKLGCEPDYNAYSMDANPKPDENTNLRTAAGHIHIGWGQDFNTHDWGHFEACCLLTKQMDFWVGLVSTIRDPDTKRKQLYGKAGAFRPKPYGMEYRVASNWWLKDEGDMRLIYANTTEAFNTMKDGIVLAEEHGDIAQAIINSNNVDAAMELCQKLAIPYWPLV
jgi:hypothetical protein